MAAQENQNNKNILIGETDIYNGITISEFPEDPETFYTILENSIEIWKQQGKRGVWLKIKPINSNLIEKALKLGFQFHHAVPTHLIMSNWLSNEPNRLPRYASHYIGAGALIINDNNELLVVKERFAARKFWKLPGGLADPGENICDTAIREAFEETGIQSSFESVLAFRFLAKYAFDCSDIFFVVRLKPLTTEIKIDYNEIENCCWMPIDEFLNHEDVNIQDRTLIKLAQDNNKCEFNSQRFEFPNGTPFFLYSSNIKN
eukprot:TRINITY_DN455_c0_g1_i1.p1 TRINITY_DN455_c0_g1~~TRINITY_DN455_c0_g1_i1.p1  ORF type:complete len:280 (+),score=120.50 TRINITY_DN455_c0_g1_i1:61-840(+)